MKLSRFTQEQIIGVLKEYQAGATMPLLRKPVTKVVVVQWPCGTAVRYRSPRVRAMFVEDPSGASLEDRTRRPDTKPLRRSATRDTRRDRRSHTFLQINR